MSKNQRKDTYYFTRPNPLQLTPSRYNAIKEISEMRNKAIAVLISIVVGGLRGQYPH